MVVCLSLSLNTKQWDKNGEKLCEIGKNNGFIVRFWFHKVLTFSGPKIVSNSFHKKTSTPFIYLNKFPFNVFFYDYLL